MWYLKRVNLYGLLFNLYNCFYLQKMNDKENCGAIVRKYFRVHKFTNGRPRYLGCKGYFLVKLMNYVDGNGYFSATDIGDLECNGDDVFRFPQLNSKGKYILPPADTLQKTGCV